MDKKMDRSDLTIYRYSYTFQIILLFINVYGFLNIIFILDKSLIFFNIKSIIMSFGWILFLISIPSLLSFKVIINADEIAVQSMSFFKLKYNKLKWIEVAKVEYHNKSAILFNKFGPKIFVPKSAWKNHKHLSLLIYQNILKSNHNFNFDHSFIEYVS